MRKMNILLILAVILLIALPLGLYGKTADFSGSDDQGTTAITQVQPGYKPWFKPLWQPSGEVESFFFALEAAIGAGFIGYFLGVSKAKKEK
ncbi:MAG: energy-coupling factor ABC transporter substrate-binding protein [Thermacetogeniaceae bacterium]